MKKIFLSLLIPLVFSCGRLEESSQKELLIGNWEWISSTGGINGKTETPISTGKNIILSFTKDSIKIFENGNLKYKNIYNFSLEKSLLDNKIKEMINYKNEIKTSYQIQNSNTLILTDDCFDCFTSSYRKTTRNYPSQALQTASF